MLPRSATRWPFNVGSVRGHPAAGVTDHVMVALDPSGMVDGDTDSVPTALAEHCVVGVQRG